MFKNNHCLFKIVNNSLIDLPAPKNISYFWNFGSMLGICLMSQILTGIFIAMSYVPHKMFAFKSVMNMCLDNNYQWSLQMLHANGASLFFMCLFFHVGRGIYYNSYSLSSTWTVGVILLFLSMGAAFMGYVLPWGQMSFWGATVITNLVATIPYLGQDIVIWLWGGFSVENPTLNRFFVLHFLIPFIILMMMIIHLLFLHQTGSNNPLGLNSSMAKISFWPYFIWKDLKGLIVLLFLMFILVGVSPFILGDPDNFSPANPLNTPVHIQPEWYFLYAYAILRAIPNKLGGVLALVLSIGILFFLPLLNFSFKCPSFFPLSKVMFWMLSFTVILLTWIGMSPMEMPFILVGQILTGIYFIIYLINPFVLNKMIIMMN